MKKLLIIAAVLAVCAGVWFICSREKVPAAAETQAAEAERAAAFVSEFRAVLAANDLVKLKALCDNPKSGDLAAQLELLRGAGLPEKPERVEFRTARSDSWSLCYPVDGGMIQIVLRRVDDGSFRFKSAYR